MTPEFLTETTIQALAIRYGLLMAAIVSLITAWRVLSFLFSMIPRPGFVSFVLSGILFLGLEVFRPILIDTWFMLSPPVYESDISPDAQTAAMEAKLSRILSPSEFQTVQVWTQTTADSIGCNIADIYAVANCECGLNPYTVRRDGIAAGWIQFTSVGLQGVPGVSLPDVIRACRNRDAGKIMKWTHTYLTNAAAGRKCSRPVDVYLLVFAPSKMGAADNVVLYSGWNNPAYYLNKCIDGWAKYGDRIVRQESLCDGRITVGELRLMLEYKTQKL
jgi:hypothetical protein